MNKFLIRKTHFFPFFFFFFGLEIIFGKWLDLWIREEDDK